MKRWCILNNEYDDEEAREIISGMFIKMERERTWWVITVNGTDLFVPDTTKFLGDDIYGVNRYPRRKPDNNLIVTAYPLKYTDDYYLIKEFAKKMPFDSVDFTIMTAIPGVIKDNEVITKKEVKA